MLRKKRKTEETTGLLLRHEESARKRPWPLQVNTGNFLIKAEFTISPVSSCFVGGSFKEKHPITKYLLFPLCSFKLIPKHFPGFACGSAVKELACERRRLGFHPWAGKIPWSRKWPTHTSVPCLGNPTDREAWWATVHGVTKELDVT